MNKKIIGVYKITNLINGKVYIGQSINIIKRWNNYKRRTFNNTYLLNAFNKYGFENFNFEILQKIEDSCLTQFLLNYFECKYIIQYNSLNRKNGYNLKEGGRSGKFSENIKKKMSISAKNKDSPIRDINILIKLARKSCIKSSIIKKGNSKIKIYGLLMKNYRDKQKEKRFHTEATKKKISLARKGKKHKLESIEKLRDRKGIKNPMYGKHKTAEQIKKQQERLAIYNPLKGRTLSEETRKKQRDSHLGKKQSEEYKEKMSKIMKGRVFTNNWKEKISKAKKDKNYMTGKKWMNKEGKDILISKEEIEEYIKQGYVLGRKNKNIKIKRICVNKEGKNRFILKEELQEFLNKDFIIGKFRK